MTVSILTVTAFPCLHEATLPKLTWFNMVCQSALRSHR